MTPDQFRRIALSLPGAEERSHMGHPDFRAGGRIFATLGAPNAGHGMVKLSPQEQTFFMHAAPGAFAPAAGAWGRGGSTLVRLRHARVAAVRAAMKAAWAACAPAGGAGSQRAASRSGAKQVPGSPRPMPRSGARVAAGVKRASSRSRAGKVAGSKRGTIPLTFAEVLRLARRLPGIEAGTSYGTPALKVRGRLLARMKEDGTSLVVKVGSIDERDLLLKSDPRVFYITDHYREYPDVLVRLGVVKPQALADLLADAWRSAAPKRMVAAFDAR